MKTYKIEIPETDLVTLPEAEKRLSKLESARVCDSKEQGFSNYEITRAEIHELVQAKAVRLGYSKKLKLSWCSDATYLFLSKTGSVYFGDSIEDYNENSNQPIAWQDFFELPEEGDDCENCEHDAIRRVRLRK